MIRVIAFLAIVLAAAMGMSWLADNPGTVTVYWPAMNVYAKPTIFQVVVALALLVLLALIGWSLVRNLLASPAAFGAMMRRRRQQKGLDALSSGMIAIGAGDSDTATRYAVQARRSLPNEPLTHLLRAQAAQLSGDRTTSRRIFEAMLASPDTEQLGLRGLFVEAEREKEPEAARQFAARALKINPKLAWASKALFALQCKAGDWAGALETLAIGRRHDHVERPLADRQRAVLLTAIALDLQERDPNRSLQLAIEAHNLAPDLIPAADLAGRMLASRGNTGKAARIIQRTWLKNPHPDLATAYAFARIGDSPRDRLERVKQLATLNPYATESAIAVANAAIDARAFDDARFALEPMLDGRLTQKIATLMARIESEQHADKGRVREWLARAVNAERDAVWTADGVVSETWAPISPVTGQLDAFQWRVPVETAGSGDAELLARKVEELVTLGAAPADRAAGDLDDATLIEGRAAAIEPEEPIEIVPEKTAPVAAPVTAPAKAAPDNATPVKAATTAVAPEATRPATVAAPNADVKTQTAAAQPVTAAQVVKAPAAASPAAAKPKPAPSPAVTAKPAEPAAPFALDKTEAIAPSTPADPNAQVKLEAAARQILVEPGTPAPVAAKPVTAAQPVKPAAAPAKPATAAAPAAEKDPTKEPRIFVVPHAPDDPGPDATDADSGRARPPYRIVT